MYYSVMRLRNNSHQLTFIFPGASAVHELTSHEAKESIYFFVCFNLSKTGIIKPNMIHCVSKLLLGSQHHPAFISKQSLIDTKKHVKQTCPLSLTHTSSTSQCMALLKESQTITLLSARGQRFLCIYKWQLGYFFIKQGEIMHKDVILRN